MWQHVIGRRSNPVTNWVERGAVRRFAEAIGDTNPLYYDEQVARQSRYGRPIAPPTFPVTFDYGEITGLALPEVGLIHGEQSFEYMRPLYVGDVLSCYRLYENTYEKKGSTGLLIFLVFALVGEDPDGAVVFTARSTDIITEAVRRSIQI